MTQEAGRPALYLRCGDVQDVRAAAELGAYGVSFELALDDAGTVRAGGDPLETLLAAADELDLAVELAAGRPLDARPATTLIAAIVADLVSGRRVRDGVRLSSFDHAAVTTIGRSTPELRLGLRHLVTLHRGDEYAARAGVTALHPLAQEATRADVERSRAAGIATHAWTFVADAWPVPEAAQVERALQAGVDAITVTDAALLAAERTDA